MPAANRPEIRRKHSTLGELRAAGLVDDALRRRLLVVTCVRNPHDRLKRLLVWIGQHEDLARFGHAF